MVKTLSVLGLVGLFSCEPNVAESKTVQHQVVVECASIPCNS